MDVLTEKEKKKLLGEIHREEVIEKDVSFSWDGKNLFVRFPKDIADYFGVNKENRFKKSLKFLVREFEGEVTNTFEILKRDHGKRKIKKKK
jgi:hypothetical protein